MTISAYICGAGISNGLSVDTPPTLHMDDVDGEQSIYGQVETLRLPRRIEPGECIPSGLYASRSLVELNSCRPIEPFSTCVPKVVGRHVRYSSAPSGFSPADFEVSG